MLAAVSLDHKQVKEPRTDFLRTQKLWVITIQETLSIATETRRRPSSKTVLLLDFYISKNKYVVFFPFKTSKLTWTLPQLVSAVDPFSICRYCNIVIDCWLILDITIKFSSIHNARISPLVTWALEQVAYRLHFSCGSELENIESYFSKGQLYQQNSLEKLGSAA